MVELSEAVKIGTKYFEEWNKSSVTKVLDADNYWIIYGGLKDKPVIGGHGIKVEKETGEISRFALPNTENFMLLKKAKPVQL